MNCPKHPNEKMTLLARFYVCDICEPPKGVVVKAVVKPTTTDGRNDAEGFLLCPICGGRAENADAKMNKAKHRATGLAHTWDVEIKQGDHIEHDIGVFKYIDPDGWTAI